MRRRIPITLLALFLAVGYAHAEEEEDKRVPGWLGVSVRSSEQDGTTSLVIDRVVAESPAAKAGLQEGDALLTVQGVPVDGMEALKQVLTAAKAGDVLRMQLLRGDEEVSAEVTLGVRPAPPSRGITGKKAPAWDVERWSGLAEGVEKLDVEDFKGKVVYLYCFQSWCPGCHEHGFPALKAVRKHYEKSPDVAFVVIQTVFEGFHANTFERGLATLKKFELTLPYAMSGGEGKRSRIMRAYNTGGTPWTIVIDPKGVVRFDGYRLEAKKAIELVDALLPLPPEEGADAAD